MGKTGHRYSKASITFRVPLSRPRVPRTILIRRKTGVDSKKQKVRMKRKVGPTPAKTRPTKKVKRQPSMVFQKNTLKAGPEAKELLHALPANLGVVGAVTFTAATLLNAATVGNDGQNNHVARKIAMKSIFVRYSCSLAATSVGGSPARILIVYDKQTNGATPAITDVLIGNDFNAPMNLDNADRFIVLMDEITDPVSVQNNYSVAKTRYKKIGLETVYASGANAGTVADIKTGGVFAFIAQTGGITVAVGSVLSLTRIKFTDA